MLFHHKHADWWNRRVFVTATDKYFTSVLGHLECIKHTFHFLFTKRSTVISCYWRHFANTPAWGQRHLHWHVIALSSHLCVSELFPRACFAPPEWHLSAVLSLSPPFRCPSLWITATPPLSKTTTRFCAASACWVLKLLSICLSSVNACKI